MYELFDKVYNNSKEEFFAELKIKLEKNKKSFIVTANPEAFMIAEREEEYRNMLLDSETEIVPDGIGLVKAGKKLGYKFKERIPGIDIVSYLLEEANNLNKKVYLFGSKEECLLKLVEVIRDKYPNIELVGYKNGYEKDKDKVFEDIKKKKPDVVFVALGMPDQEKLIYKHLKDFKKGIFVGVGGSFDVLSGQKKRAPKIFQKLNIEWLYRIVKEPKRIKRFYNNNVKFLLEIDKISGKKKNKR